MRGNVSVCNRCRLPWMQSQWVAVGWD